MGERKLLILVTPTYKRPDRLEFLKRMIQHVNAAHHTTNDIRQIIIEDADRPDPTVFRLLRDLCMYPYMYMSVGPTRDKGHEQRNYAYELIAELNWLGPVYNLDDDNDFKPKLLQVVSNVEKIGVLPVGNLGPNGVEKAIVKNGKVIGWDAGWTERKFAIDMAGFAFNSVMFTHMDRPYWKFRNGPGGETEFIGRIADKLEDLEVLTEECLVWHNEPLKNQPKELSYKEGNLQGKLAQPRVVGRRVPGAPPVPARQVRRGQRQ